MTKILDLDVAFPSEIPLLDSTVTPVSTGSFFLMDFEEAGLVDTDVPYLTAAAQTNLLATEATSMVGSALPVVYSPGEHGGGVVFNLTPGLGLWNDPAVGTDSSSFEAYLAANTGLNAFAYSDGVEANQPDIAYIFYIRFSGSIDAVAQTGPTNWGNWLSSTQRIYADRIQSGEWIHYTGSVDGRHATSLITPNNLYQVGLSKEKVWLKDITAGTDGTLIRDGSAITYPDLDAAGQTQCMILADWSLDLGPKPIIYRWHMADLRASGQAYTTLEELAAADEAWIAGRNWITTV